jgi:flavin reductase (DIM6/NTAB) family NADH-FMN oxidoreductase RutF
MTRIGEPAVERDGVFSFDPADAHGGMYHLLNAAIAPRPIAWVSSLAADGTYNLAPHSYTTVLSPIPPVVGFVSIGRKDTWRNVDATGDFVYHLADESLMERLNRSAADFPPDVSEFAWAGLTPVASDLVRSPRVGEAPIAFEAKLTGIVRILETDNALIMGQIVRVHVAEAVTQDGRIDPEKVKPFGRLSGNGYARLGEVFSMPRPTYRALLEAGAQPLARRAVHDRPK